MSRNAAVPPSSNPASRHLAWLGFGADVLMTLGLMLVLSLVAGIAWALLKGGQGTDIPVLAQIAMAIVSTGGTAVLMYLARRRASDVEKQSSLAAMYRPSTWGWAVGAGLLVFAGTNVISLVMSQLVDLPTPSNMGLMGQAMDRYPVVLVGFAVVLAPFYEELLFRRVLFGRLASAGLVWTGIIVTSLLFALTHEIPGLSDNGWLGTAQLWLVYGLMGAVFAWVYHRTGTLFAAILAHGINNGLALILMASGLAGA